MLNYRYNIINLIKIALSVLNMVLMLRLFGFSQGSDIYLLAYSLIMSWHFIPLLFMGQFIQFYNDLKVESEKLAHNFYNQSLMYSFCLGILLFTACFLFLKPIVHLYTLNLDSERLSLLIQTLHIMIFSNIFAPVVSLTEQLYIAERKFLLSYLLQIIMLLGPTIMMCSLIFLNNPNIKLLAISYALSVFASAIFGAIYCAKKLIPFKFIFKTKNFIKFIRNSFSMYSGLGIFNCLFPIVLNNFLVIFTNGIISCFYYSKNAIEAVSLIAIDYTNKNTTSEISKLVAHKDTGNIKKIIKKYLQISPLLFFVTAIIVYFMIPIVLKVVFYKTGISLDGKIFANIFLSLIPWYIIFTFSCPYSYTNTFGKKSYAVIIANLCFVGVTAIILQYCSKNIYNISYAMFFAQIIAFIIYWYCAQKTLKALGKE